MEAYGDGYMEPEEEWEREGLLDPAWEKQQKKVSESSFLREGFYFFRKKRSLQKLCFEGFVRLCLAPVL